MNRYHNYIIIITICPLIPLQGHCAGQNRLQRGAGVCKNGRRIETVTKGKDDVDMDVKKSLIRIIISTIVLPLGGWVHLVFSYLRWLYI